MVKQLIEDIKFSKDGEKFILDKQFKFELTEEEYNKFKKDLTGTIDTLNKEIKKCDSDAVQIATLNALKGLEIQYKKKQDALLNFKKYQANTIKEFKEKSEEKKKEMFEFCQNIEKTREELKRRVKEEILNKKKEFQEQLKQNLKDIEPYKTFDNANN